MIIKGVKLFNVGFVVDASFSLSGAMLYLDAGNTASYPGSGTTWYDLSGQGHNATGLTGYSYSSSNLGYISFNGTSGSGALPSGLYNQTYTGKTIFVAGNLTSLSSGAFRCMIGSNTATAANRNFNFYMYCPSTGAYEFHFSAANQGVFSSNLPYTAGNWFTGAVVQTTAGTATFYFNGTAVNSVSMPFGQYISGNNEYIGAGDNYWYGALPVAAVYSTALTAQQILQNHNSVKTRYGLS